MSSVGCLRIVYVVSWKSLQVVFNCGANALEEALGGQEIDKTLLVVAFSSTLVVLSRDVAAVQVFRDCVGLFQQHPECK